jgi:hypothetical protein
MLILQRPPEEQAANPGITLLATISLEFLIASVQAVWSQEKPGKQTLQEEPREARKIQQEPGGPTEKQDPGGPRERP